MGRCFQGKASTKFSKAISTVNPANINANIFKESQKDYLENISEIKNLGDCIIRQLRDLAKTAAMDFDDYLDRLEDYKLHLEGSMPRNTLAAPTEQQWADQIFSQQPKTHHLKYNEKHEEVDKDFPNLKLFFNGFHKREVSEVTFSRIMKNSADARK